MFKIYFTGCCLLGYLFGNIEAFSATFIKPCKAEDKACILASTQTAIHAFVEGIPELNIPPMDPIFVESGKLDNENLLLKYTNISINAVKGVKVHDIERDVKANTIKLSGQMPIRAVGQYELDGKILFLNLYGKGGFEITTDQANFVTTYKIKHVTGDDGKKHWKISSFDYTYDVIKKVHFKLENLLGGDENSGKLIQQVLDTNWKEIVQEIGDPIIRELVTVYVGHINKFFLAVPSDELEVL